MSEKEKQNLDETEMTQNKQPKDSKEAKEPKAAKPKKDKAKAEKDKKPGVGKRIGRFFRELKAELKKVAWPSRASLSGSSTASQAPSSTPCSPSSAAEV